jgi:3-hydroxybutyryl-CoA dehydratase
MTRPVLAVGDAAPERRFGPLDRVAIARFAGAGGDFNPLHLDPEVARAAGFDDVIAMGQLQAGVVAAAISDWVGAERVLRFEVRYASPFGLGDELVVSARVTRVEDGVATVTAEGVVGDRTVITAEARAKAADDSVV